MHSEGYGSRSVCLSVCLSVYLFVCQRLFSHYRLYTRRLMSDTNSFSATRARKIMRKISTYARELYGRHCALVTKTLQILYLGPYIIIRRHLAL